MRSGLVSLVAAVLLFPVRPALAGTMSLQEQALTGAKAALERCYQGRLAVREGLEGDIVFHMVVAYSGTVTKVTVRRDTVGDPPLATCAAAALKTVTMPGSPSGGEVDVPLHFAPGSGVTLGPKAKAPEPAPSTPPGTAPADRTGPIPPPEAPNPPATGTQTPGATPKAPQRPTANPARPTFSDNAMTTDPGALEIEAGGILTPGAPNQAPLDGGITTLFKYGIAPHYDARIGWAEGFGQGDGGTVQLFFKATLSDPEPDTFGFAVEPYLSVATPPAAKENALGGILIATLPFANRFELDANVVLQGAWVGPGTYAFEVDPVATLSASIAHGLGVFGEVYGLIPADAAASAIADAGLTFTVQSNLVLDASVTRILTRSATPWTFQAGLTYSFYLLGAPPRG